jgi:hypothetical protein
MAYSTPELLRIGTAHELVLGHDSLPDLGCIEIDDVSGGESRLGELW